MSDMPAETIRISQATIDDTFMAIGELDFTSFRDAEYGRLAEQRDPAEQLIKEAFAILIARVGEQDARRFMVGSLLLTRSLYVEAAAQGLTIRRLDVLMVGTQVEAIAQAFDPRRSFDLDDIYDEFPNQGPLCGAVNGLSSSATRVGALTMTGVYAHHLIAPGHKMSLRIGDLTLPGGDSETGQVSVTPAE